MATKHMGFVSGKERYRTIQDKVLVISGKKVRFLQCLQGRTCLDKEAVQNVRREGSRHCCFRFSNRASEEQQMV